MDNFIRIMNEELGFDVFNQRSYREYYADSVYNPNITFYPEYEYFVNRSSLVSNKTFSGHFYEVLRNMDDNHLFSYSMWQDMFLYDAPILFIDP